MQGMIMHHGQAVEMTAMIESRTQDKAVRLIGAKISQSQTDEINFMKRWLEMKGEKTEMPMQRMSNMEMSGMRFDESFVMPACFDRTNENIKKTRRAPPPLTAFF